MSAKSTSPPPAYFLSLSLENVRSFGEKQTISFAREDGRPAPWTVILGDNGVGKTTVLRCLASVMPVDTPNEYPIQALPDFPQEWIKEDYPPRYFLDTMQKWLVHRKNTESGNFKWQFAREAYLNLNYSKKKQEVDDKMFIKFSFSPNGKFKFGTQEVYHKKSLGLICYGYGASRTTGKSTLGDTATKDNCLSLFDEHADLLNAEEWFLQADYRIKSDDSPLIRQNFELLKAALIDILDEVTEIKVSPVAPGGNPQQGLQFLTPYGWVRLREMSLGYQTMVVWITDFASKLFIRYPESKNPLAEPAIVLIDEIDLHLHPEWQRKLIGYLSRLFPNTQFIATAHSPLVVQAAGDAGANVVLLKRVGDQTIVVQDLEDVRGWRVDQILSSELFDSTPARSPATEEKLARRRTLLAKKKLTKADKEALAQLNAELPPLPFGDTPELQQADATIQALLQKLGKQPKAA
ncbi:AAA family ATPase [Hymenobacter arcticus]